jgi:hypothetical protein
MSGRLQIGRPPVTLGQMIIARLGETSRRAVSTGERVGSQAIGLVAAGQRDHLLPPRHPRRVRLDLGDPPAGLAVGVVSDEHDALAVGRVGAQTVVAAERIRSDAGLAASVGGRNRDYLNSIPAPPLPPHLRPGNQAGPSRRNALNCPIEGATSTRDTSSRRRDLNRWPRRRCPRSGSAGRPAVSAAGNRHDDPGPSHRAGTLVTLVMPKWL